MHTYAQNYTPERLPSVPRILMVFLATVVVLFLLVLAGIAGDVG